MDVERTNVSLYPGDKERIKRLAQIIVPRYEKQYTTKLFRALLTWAEIVVGQNNGELPDDIRRALEEDTSA